MKPLNAWPAPPDIPDFLPEMDQTMPLAVQLALGLMAKGERVLLKSDAHTAEPLSAATVVPHSDYPKGAILFNTFRLHNPGSLSLNYEDVDAEADLAKIGRDWTLIPIKRYA